MLPKISSATIAILVVSMFCTSMVFGQTDENSVRPARVPESVYKEGYEAVKKLFNQAVVAGDLEVCKELLEINAVYVNEADVTGLTQLHFAAMSGQADLCRLLLQHGAKADIVRKGASRETYYTPLEAAIANNHTEAALILIDTISPESLKPVRGRNSPPLFLAIMNENVEIINALLAKNADVNTPGKIGDLVQTPFVYTVALGNVEIGKILLEAGVDLCFEQGDVRTSDALFFAALSRDYDLCSFLVDSKINLDARNHDGQMVLHNLFRIDRLFAAFRSVDPFKEAELPFAVTGPYKRVAPLFPLDHTEPPKSGEFFEADDDPSLDLKTHQFCKLFLDAGIDVNARDKNGCSVLETLLLAQIDGPRQFEDFQALLELLIAAKVDLNAADENGWTPLFYLLFYAFCDDQEDEEELTESQMQAIAERKIALFKMLTDAGADVKIADQKGNTLLHYIVQPPGDAIKGWNIDLDYETRGVHRLFSRQLIEFLVEKGVSLSDKNKDGETPLDWATQGPSGRTSRGGMGGMGGMGGADSSRRMQVPIPSLPSGAADLLSF